MEEIGDRSTDQNENHINTFRLLHTIVQLIGVTIVILMVSWISIYLGGVGISTPKLEFNWHPLLMIIGMIFLYGNSILLYRGCRYSKKIKLKISHATLFGIVMVLTILALVAVFDSHNYADPPIPNMYSLHSWVGLGAVIIFFCQWVAGFISFMYPQIKPPLKNVYMPVHVYFGLFGYILGILAAVLGLSEKAFFVIKDISQLPHQSVLVNCMGVLILIFGALVCYLATKREYRRIPLPEDTMLLTGSTE